MKTDGANLSNGKIKIAEGWYADDRLRVGGILYLEEKTGKTFTEFADVMSKAFADPEGLKITDMFGRLAPLLEALIVQANPELDDDAVRRLLMQMEIDDFMQVFEKLKIFETSAKNPSRPNPKKKAAARRRKPVRAK